MPTGTQTHRPAYTHAHSHARTHTETPSTEPPFLCRRMDHRHSHLDAQAHPIKLGMSRSIPKAAQIGRLAAEAAYQKLEPTRDVRS